LHSTTRLTRSARRRNEAKTHPSQWSGFSIGSWKWRTILARPAGHDGDALGVDGAEVGVLEEADQVRLGGLLEREDRVRLEAQVRLEVLHIGPDGYCSPRQRMPFTSRHEVETVTSWSQADVASVTAPRVHRHKQYAEASLRHAYDADLHRLPRGRRTLNLATGNTAAEAG